MSEDLTRKLPSSDSEKLNQILTSVGNLSSTVENLSSTVESLRADVSDVRVRLGNVEQRLGNLEQKVEERLHDTRPIWEKVTTDIDHLKEESYQIKTFLRDIFRRLSIFNDTLTTMQADYRDIYDRVRGLELRGT